MAIQIAASRQSLAATYATLGTFLAVCTGNPGTTTTVANEATGGGYARLATTWTPGAGGVENGSAVTLSVPAGTFTFGALCSAATGATQVDNAAITSTVFSVAGQLVMTPAFTQT
jgi:hypothetical protein